MAGSATSNLEGRQSSSQWLSLVALGACVTACTLEITMLFPALPALIRDFADPAAVFWTVTIQYLVAASSVALCGRLGDLFGRKRVLLVVLSLALCGSLLSLISTALWGIIIGRGIQAISAAAIPLSFGIVRELLPANRVPSGIGLVATVAPVMGGVGGVLGGVLVDYASWRLLFAVSAVSGILAVALVWWAIPQRTAGARMKIDIVGGLLVPPAIAALLLAIHHSRHWGWMDARTLGLFAAGLALLPCEFSAVYQVERGVDDGQWALDVEFAIR